MSWALVNEPTPCCKIPREDCEPWPTLEIYKTLELVHGQDLGSLDGRRQATLYLSIMLEMLLEYSLWELLQLYTNSDKLAEIILEAYSGKERRISLYNKLSYQKLGNLFKSNEDLKDFLNNWNSIANVRNKIMHGRSDYSDDLPEVIKLILGQPFYPESILRVSLKAFIEVNNDIQQMRIDAT